MIRTLRYRTILRTIHPPEADYLANELRSCARQVDSYRQEVDRMITELGTSWSGNQKDVFVSSISQVPMRLLYIIEMFKNYADFFQNLQVTVEESVPVTP